MESLRESLGNRIRELRRSERLTQEALAGKAGIHATYLGAVERGERNVSVDNIGKIAMGLGVQPVELFRFQPYRSPENVKGELRRMLRRHDPELVLSILELLERASGE